jgi:hypothetical protein
MIEWLKSIDYPLERCQNILPTPLACKQRM